MTELPTANPEVIFRRVGDGAVLLFLADEVYYGLNTVGARIWELLPPASGTFADLVAVLESEYSEIPRSTIAQDARELLEQLERHGLVTPYRGAENPPSRS